MKKRIVKKYLTEGDIINLNEVYKSILQFYEDAQKEKEKSEKEFLLKKLKELTKNKEIVLSNYSSF